MPPLPHCPAFVDFFAGSGLVTQGAKHACTPVWSNDICPKKAEIYTANHGTGHFHLGSIKSVCGRDVPPAAIVWASFPCQDLSLAGNMGGLAASRSGLFWEWLRVLDEMPVKPRVLALENVVGLLSANGGRDYCMLHAALRKRSYRVGPMLVDARLWLPHSRPRVFIVAVLGHLPTGSCEDAGPNWLHPEPVRRAASWHDDSVYWSMPMPKTRPKGLCDLVDWDAPVFDREKTAALCAIIAPKHKELLRKLPVDIRAVFPGYRRTRRGKQVLELRFDNVSGCLRTAEGGSSRQFLILHRAGTLEARLITSREAARLMGAPERYRLSASYNESYNAMGDAVAVPVVKHLMDHLLVPLSAAAEPHVSRSSKPLEKVRLIA